MSTERRVDADASVSVAHDGVRAPLDPDVIARLIERRSERDGARRASRGPTIVANETRLFVLRLLQGFAFALKLVFLSKPPLDDAEQRAGLAVP